MTTSNLKTKLFIGEYTTGPGRFSSVPTQATQGLTTKTFKSESTAMAAQAPRDPLPSTLKNFQARMLPGENSRQVAESFREPRAPRMPTGSGHFVPGRRVTFSEQP